MNGATMTGDLVAANRILGREGILDAYGHVSARSADPGVTGDAVFVLSRARAPELVEQDDLLEFSADGEPLTPAGRPLYLERYIHAAIYAARPDAALGDAAVVLLRGHGCVVAGRTPQEVVSRCIAMDRNARVQEIAHRLGEYTPLHPGECADARHPGPPLARDNREWEYFLRRAGLSR